MRVLPLVVLSLALALIGCVERLPSTTTQPDAADASGGSDVGTSDVASGDASTEDVSAPDTSTGDTSACPTTCSRPVAACGAIDACGTPLDCSCPDGESCSDGVCTCLAETNQELCAAATAECGSLDVTDACGVQRSTMCGTCTAPEICGPQGRCHCPEEPPTVFCSRYGADCGTFVGLDLCGVQRTEECGLCTGTCTDNVCDGCVPDDDATFCQNLSKECGAQTGIDNCNQARTADCGACTQGASCMGGVCRYPPLPACAATDARSSKLSHGLIVAPAGVRTAGTLEYADGVTGIVPFVGDGLAGRLNVGATGAFVLDANTAPGTYEVGVDLEFAGSTEPACVVVVVIDPSAPGIKTLSGSNWENESAWTPVGVPGASDTAFVPAGVKTVATPSTVGSLFVANGGTLLLNASFAATNGAMVGGEAFGPITLLGGTVGGRMETVLCAGATSVSTTMKMSSFAELGSCSFAIGSWPVRVSGNFEMGSGIGAISAADGGLLDVDGVFDFLSTSVQSAGVFRLSGGTVFAQHPLSGDHTYIFDGPGAQTIQLAGARNMILTPGGSATFVISFSMSGRMTTARPTHATGGVISVSDLVLQTGFSTTTPGAWSYSVCDDSSCSCTQDCQTLAN